MPKTLKILPVEKKNITELLALIKELALYEKLPPPDKEAMKRLKDDCLATSPKFEAFLLYDINTPIGYLMIYMTYSSFLARSTLHIEDLFILKDQRKNGGGKMLFEYAKKLARDRECGRIEWIVLDWNKLAIGFYEKNGATHLEDWRLYRMSLLTAEDH